MIHEMQQQQHRNALRFNTDQMPSKEKDPYVSYSGMNANAFTGRDAEDKLVKEASLKWTECDRPTLLTSLFQAHRIPHGSSQTRATGTTQSSQSNSFVETMTLLETGHRASSHYQQHQRQIYTPTDEGVAWGRPSSGRPRSRAIAIKRSPMPRVDTNEEEIRADSSERMYDWATWRMYNRIIDHRQKHPLGSNYEGAASCGDSDVHEKLSHNASEARQIRPVPLRHSDYALDGEIFDLDI